MSNTRVLVVEDEIVVSEDLQHRLRLMGYEVVGAADTAAEAIEIATAERPDVALMDIMLHGKPEGIDAAEHLKRKLSIPVIYLTAHSDSATLQKAKLTDPSGFIVKPFEERQLQAALEMAPHRHEMESKVRRAAGWLKATLSSVGDAVIATNINSEVLLLNTAAEKLTGWSREDAAGKSSHEVLRLIDGKTRQSVEDPAACAMRYGSVIRLAPDTLLMRRDGRELYVDNSAAPIINETGEILGAVVILVDATDRAEARNRLQVLSEQVNQLAQEKQAREAMGNEMETFAAAVSHDLRTPLRAITGYSELLEGSYLEQLDPSGRHFLQCVRDSAVQMNSMVDDYLNFMRLSHKQALRLTPIDLRALAQSVFAELTALPQQKSARLVCEAAMPQVYGDASMMRQVLVNLLSNALKYASQREEPLVEVGATPGTDMHTCYVRDNGVGLDMEQAEKLFEPFQRFHNAPEYPGTGVGLAIVKRIIERHGGRIWAVSRPDAGATFYFTLPAHAEVATA